MAYKLRRVFTRIAILTTLIGVVLTIIGKVLPSAASFGTTYTQLTVNGLISFQTVGELLFLIVLLILTILLLIAYNNGIARRKDERMIGLTVLLYEFFPWSILIDHLQGTFTLNAYGTNDLGWITYIFTLAQDLVGIQVGVGIYILLIGVLTMLLGGMLLLVDYYSTLTRPVKRVQQ